MMRNNMQITPNWSRSKLEVKFQYGGHLYFETGSSYISAAIWDISTKFGLLIDFNLLKAMTSTDTKSEVVFSRCRRRLDKAIWRYISVVPAPILTKFGRLMQNKMQITGKWSRSESEVEFQYGRRLFFQTRSRYISAINLYMLTIKVDEIWFVDKFWPSEGNDINKYETGSSIERPRQPFWKIDKTSYFHSSCRSRRTWQ